MRLKAFALIGLVILGGCKHTIRNENNNTVVLLGPSVTPDPGPAPQPGPGPVPQPDPAPGPGPNTDPGPQPQPQPQPTTPKVNSINVTPDTFLCSIGGQVTLNVGVMVDGDAATTVRWDISNTNILTVRSEVGNTLILDCKGIGNVSVTATSHADSSKSDTSTGTVKYGSINCSWSPSTGLQSDNSVRLTKGQNVGATAVCINEAGYNFLPFWYSSRPDTVGVAGEQTVTIKGVQYPAGTNATLTGVWTGEGVITVQAAIDETSPAYSRTVRVQ